MKNEKNRTLYIPIGIPGCGKSTIGEALSEIIPDIHVCGLDKTREALYPGYEDGIIDYTTINQNLVYLTALDEALEESKNKHIFWDATNLKIYYRTEVIIFLQKKCYLNDLDLRIIFINIECPFSTIIKRNEKRTGLRKLPTETLERFYREKIEQKPQKHIEIYNELWNLYNTNESSMHILSVETDDTADIFIPVAVHLINQKEETNNV